MAQHTLAVVIIASEEMTTMKNVMLAIRAFNSHRHSIMMYVEDFHPQRHHHNEQ
ncbi:MAG: hypothetical protein J6Y05_06300 [Bacteroidales bacterium]|nr:hypothetical protein [Bacteroidales bacterium]